MPEARLERTREAYELRCGHINEMTRRPARFRPRGADARFCLGCGQWLDSADDAEAAARMHTQSLDDIE